MNKLAAIIGVLALIIGVVIAFSSGNIFSVPTLIGGIIIAVMGFSILVGSLYMKTRKQ
jgi:hypothetical protein